MTSEITVSDMAVITSGIAITATGPAGIFWAGIPYAVDSEGGVRQTGAPYLAVTDGDSYLLPQDEGLEDIMRFVLRSDGAGDFIFQDSLVAVYGLGSTLFDAMNNWVDMASELLDDLNGETDLSDQLQFGFDVLNAVARRPEIG